MFFIAEPIYRHTIKHYTLFDAKVKYARVFSLPSLFLGMALNTLAYLTKASVTSEKKLKRKFNEPSFKVTKTANHTSLSNFHPSLIFAGRALVP